MNCNRTQVHRECHQNNALTDPNSIQKLEMIEAGLQGCKDMAMNCKNAMHELQISFMSKMPSDLGSVHHCIMQM